jgi:hypothetical protein
MAKKNVLKKVVKGYVLLSTIYTGAKFIQCRGLGKEDDRHMIGKAIDRMAGLSVEHDDVITIDDTEMHVSYNPYLQLFTNSLGGVAVVLKGTTEVYTDAQFRKMSKSTQRAILAHEMGHYKHKHNPGLTYQLDRLKSVMNNKVLKMELEADAYACGIVGPWQMIEALKELSTIKGVSKKELKLRINYIKSNIRERVGQCDATGNIVGYIIYDGFHREIGREEVTR